MTNKLPPLPDKARKVRIYSVAGGRDDYDEDDFALFYSAAQMKAYGQACRDAALEEAARVCDDEWNGDSETYGSSVSYNECAVAIRDLL